MDRLLALLPIVLIILIATTMLLRGDRGCYPGDGVPRSWVALAAAGGFGAALMMAAIGATGGRNDWWDVLTTGAAGFAVGAVALLLIDRLGYSRP
jgi:hypothetical protein